MLRRLAREATGGACGARKAPIPAPGPGIVPGPGLRLSSAAQSRLGGHRLARRRAVFVQALTRRRARAAASVCADVSAAGIQFPVAQRARHARRGPAAAAVEVVGRGASLSIAETRTALRIRRTRRADKARRVVCWLLTFAAAADTKQRQRQQQRLTDSRHLRVPGRRSRTSCARSGRCGSTGPGRCSTRRR